MRRVPPDIAGRQTQYNPASLLELTIPMLRPALLLILLLISTTTHAAAPDLILAGE